MIWNFFLNKYQGTGEVLILRSEILEYTTALLHEYQEQEVESCCFWYGLSKNSFESLATTIVIPHQENSRCNFHISGEAMKLVSQTTRPLDLVNLAQVHTHPGKMVKHSGYDNDHVNSRNTLSIILPNYGLIPKHWPIGIGVHEFQNDTWHTLSKRQANMRIRIVDGEVKIIDLR
jgi:hypothetical protein